VLAGESVVEASLLQEQPGQSSRKRSADAAGPSDHDSAFPERAHSVTVNLGMLSLNSDSPQKHYLGSSSGLLFANLIGASPSSTASTPQNVGEHAANAAIQSEWRDELGDPARDHARRYNQSLIVLLRQVSMLFEMSILYSRRSDSAQELPRKDDALVLVHNYLRWIHPDYPILEPASLMSALAALYSCVSSASDADLYQSGWPRATPTFRWNGVQVTPGATEDETVSLSVVAFIFFMIFSISALVKVRSRVYDFPPDKFYRAAMHISQGAFAQVSLSSIQALVMLIAHSMLTPAEVKLWTLVHLALAHCVEVGIHREQHEDGPPNFVLQQIRRFTFFTIYSLDRYERCRFALCNRY
jgi:hypothetical protein